MTAHLTAAEYVRARTFLVEITQALLPEGTTSRTEGDEWRADHTGGLSISIRKAEWHFWGSGEGGYSPIILISKLRPAYAIEECAAWLLAWLAQHPGTGTCSLESDDDGDSPASRARAREVLDAMQPVEGTPAEVYLRSRSLEPPYDPNCIGYIEDARRGEGAFAAILTAHGRVVGVQVGYLTPSGTKSLISPQRERFNLERQKGAVFRLPASPEALAGPRDPVTDYLAVEGIEDALTLRQIDRPCMVFGLPGIAALAHLDLPLKSRVVVFEDGDEKDSPADRGCVRGIDHLLNAGMYVWTVPTPLGLDANAILGEANLGIDALRSMLRRENLVRGELSFEARVANLAKLDGIAFAQERTALGKIFKVSVTLIDDELKKHRPPKPPRADYLSAPAPPTGWTHGVVTNPPYGSAQEFAEKALREVPYVALLVRTNFLMDGEARGHWLDRNPPTRTYYLLPRLPMIHRHGWEGTRSTSNTPHAWVVWQKGARHEYPQRVYWQELLNHRAG